MHSVETDWTALDTSSLSSFVLCLAFVFASAASFVALCSFCPKIILRRWNILNPNHSDSQPNSVTFTSPHPAVYSVTEDPTTPNHALDIPPEDGFYDGDMMYETIPEELQNPHYHNLARIKASIKEHQTNRNLADVSSPTPAHAHFQSHSQRASGYRTREECPDLTPEEVDAMYSQLDKEKERVGNDRRREENPTPFQEVPPPVPKRPSTHGISL
uniref:uncharacterized protein isoform X2 n=1 Tax=Myxine glutinosa TaxID=7769 RepID=UPI00358EEB8F